ncbi:MAG: glucose-1-phosphate cytidylyltransferase [candidate division Zixibacteria bacterium]|nr:glucose-1-phosphate cytidylyltransferase [candidate division Zixibacteria bacterium]
MKVAILAGGVGSRLSEETELKPKPMVEIGGYPILWHIMMIYSHHGFNEFVIALGYKGQVIKKYILDYCSLHSNLTVFTKNGMVDIHDGAQLNWKVDLIDTGIKTQTGGRVKRLARYLENETFMLTWGDGVSNINIKELMEFHKSHGKLATITAVRPPARFGHLSFNGDRVEQFTEKPQTAEGWINGAFFVLEPKVLDYIDDDGTHFEREPLERLAADGQLMAYKHTDFWQCMDTLRDKVRLEKLWESDNPPWKIW